MFPNYNTFTDAPFDHSILGNGNHSSHEYLLEGIGGWPPTSATQATRFDHNQLASLSAAELEALCMAPESGFQMGPVPGANGFNLGAFHPNISTSSIASGMFIG